MQAQILNNDNTIDFSKEVVILNFHGELSKFFKFAKSVFIGKSMVKKLKYDGGQNPITAAKMSCNIYHGPFVSNFREIYDYLAKLKLSSKINNHLELSSKLENLFSKKNRAINCLSNYIYLLYFYYFSELMLYNL